MVDNLSHMNRDLAEKEIWIGEEFDPDTNFIKVDEFWGGPATPLTEYIPKIEELLRFQEVYNNPVFKDAKGLVADVEELDA